MKLPPQRLNVINDLIWQITLTILSLIYSNPQIVYCIHLTT